MKSRLPVHLSNGVDDTTLVWWRRKLRPHSFKIRPISFHTFSLLDAFAICYRGIRRRSQGRKPCIEVTIHDSKSLSHHFHIIAGLSESFSVYDTTNLAWFLQPFSSVFSSVSVCLVTLHQLLRGRCVRKYGPKRQRRSQKTMILLVE